MTEFTQIKLDTADGIATLTLSRPEKMNAFTGVMMQEMIDAIDITDADDSVRAAAILRTARKLMDGVVFDGQD